MITITKKEIETAFSQAHTPQEQYDVLQHYDAIFQWAFIKEVKIDDDAYEYLESVRWVVGEEYKRYKEKLRIERLTLKRATYSQMTEKELLIELLIQHVMR